MLIAIHDPIVYLGQCRRFRLVSFRDKEAWSEQYEQFQRVARAQSSAKSHPNSKTQPTSELMENLPNHQRQAFLAADRLGENAMDGSEAVKSGLAKRGITRTYIMLEGCPKKLGCTVILRGASRASLKQVKRIFTFLLTVGYNLKLETSYYRERRVCLPEDYQAGDGLLTTSSSLCVDYGKHPLGRKTRPWNGVNTAKAKTDLSRSMSGKITAFDHQSILITSVWMTDKTQCCPAEVKGICYYSLQDVSLGQFLRDSCFNLDLKCQNPSCKKSVLEHSLSFIHNDGRINITVEKMDNPLPPKPNKSQPDNLRSIKKSPKDKKSSSSNEPDSAPIATWTYCTKCRKVVTPLVYISDDTWQLSFGKFIEIYFYNKDFLLNTPDHECSCQMQIAAILYFGCGRIAARFTYEKIEPYGVYVRRFLPFDEEVHLKDALVHLEKISNASTSLFVRFDKHIERISRETRQLFSSPVINHDHLQTVLGELNVIGSEVDHAAKIMQEKIAAVTNSRHESQQFGANDRSVGDRAVIRFPWHSRRYLALLTSVWNERLSAVGQALTAMKKLAASSQSKGSGSRGEIAVVGMNAAANAIVGEGYGDKSDDVMEGMKRLWHVQESYSRYNVKEMDIRSYNNQITSKRDQSRSLDDFGHEKKHHSRPPRSLESDNDYNDYDDDAHDDLENEMLDSSNHDFDSYIIDEGPDADALASRRRQYQKTMSEAPIHNHSAKSIGSKRQSDANDPQNRSSHKTSTSSSQFKSYEETSKSKTVTPGGAVKSALTRFFNRGNKELDPYVVDLGIFAEGSPRLEPGRGGMVIPVYDDQPSTVIAHSLSSEEYYKQFRKYTEMEGGTKTNSDGSSDDESRPNRHRGSSNSARAIQDDRKDIERRMLVRSKAHIKHTFKELDVKGQQVCKFICTTFWATQFHAVRQAFLSSSSTEAEKGKIIDVDETYIQSLSASHSWAASGGKSGASFSLTKDGRFVVKCISRTELQMFLDCAPAYFEYLSKAFFHGL